MTNQINTFSFNRFSLFLKCYIGENRRTLFILGTIILCLPTLLLCVSTWLGQDVYEISRYYGRDYFYSYPELHVDPQRWMVIFVFVSLSLIFAMVCGSMTFSTLSTKSSRENFLTIPATMLEKFTALFLIYIVAYVVLMFLSINIANQVRVILFGHLSQNLCAIPFKETFGMFPNGYVYRNMVAWWGFYGVVMTTFMVGSSLWPKNSFIKTMVAIIALIIVVFSLGGIAFVSYGLFSRSFEARFEWMEHEATMLNILMITEAVYSVAAIIFSYFRLKQWELVSRW